MSKEFERAFGLGSGLSGCDFRPHFDGSLFNAHRLITPAETRDAHLVLVWTYAREMAAWIIQRRNRFEPGDRFQLIVGWPESVRTSARQIVKFGGGFEDLYRIAAAATSPAYEAVSGQRVFRTNWDLGIYM